MASSKEEEFGALQEDEGPHRPPPSRAPRGNAGLPARIKESLLFFALRWGSHSFGSRYMLHGFRASNLRASVGV